MLDLALLEVEILQFPTREQDKMDIQILVEVVEEEEVRLEMAVQAVQAS
jgi:hypothetical protein